jgi:ABC-type nitrate/sulfonate/bicarbonate transport system substrate-binding protein
MKKSTLNVIALALLLVSLGSCREQSQGPRTIILAESSFSMPVALSFIAREKGYWKEEGLDVRLSSFAAGRLALDALLGGSAQFATVGQTPLATAAFRNRDFVIVSEMANSPKELGIVARKSAGIRTPADLVGKKVAFFSGTQSDFYLTLFLKRFGIARNQVTAVSLTPPDSVIALKNKDVDAIAAWPPHLFNAEVALGDDGVLFSPDNLYNAVMSMVSTRAYATENREVVEGILNGLRRAQRFTQTDREEAIRIVANQIKLDVDIVRAHFDDYDFTVKSSRSVVDALNAEGRWAMETGLVGRDARLPDYQSFLLFPRSKN